MNNKAVFTSVVKPVEKNVPNFNDRHFEMQLSEANLRKVCGKVKG